MKEKRTPFVSILTLCIMGVAAIMGAIKTNELYLFFYGIPWSVCIVVLFLDECLFGLMKKRFSQNIGAFAASAVIGVFLVISLISETSSGSSFFAFKPPSALSVFLPPLIVSLFANIGILIGKLTHADRG